MLSDETLCQAVHFALEENIYCNFNATEIALKEITRRADLAAQLEAVRIFHSACTWYEAGHP
ncbi:MAG TPA: hypothetical protein VLC92_11765 [Rhodocyclaceae bacterium]|nr:hypothetical protein [Rhodocyclaceae bacterium]